MIFKVEKFSNLTSVNWRPRKFSDVNPNLTAKVSELEVPMA